jgi:hypothetical protein
VGVILLSKFAVAFLVSEAQMENLTGDFDDEGLLRAVAVKVAEENVKLANQGRRGFGMGRNWAMLKKFEDFPIRIRVEAMLRWQQMSPEERSALEEELTELRARSAWLRLGGAFLLSFGVLDILWFSLASGLAFQIGSGATG